MSTVSNRLKQLADTIESLENHGRPVTNISTSTGELCSNDGLNAQFSVKIPLPFQSGDDDGESAFTATEAELRKDGSVLVSFEGAITDQEIEAVSENERLDQQSGESSGSPSPHRDPESLREAYEQCDTFVEMKQTLGTDVTPEAVRQQMVKHGIHEVPEDDVSEASSDQEKSREDSIMSPDMVENNTQAKTNQSDEIFISDGGFPSNMTVEDLEHVVKSSRTLYEATQKLQVDQEEARKILKRLNLLDLVIGRLSTKEEQEVTSEEIERRINSSNILQT
ncbi:hypothetical protein [Natronomonas amylolytica]|uniref:hypothetical protein n=1 Tax=Natronomonas amylolytica TaxID=3108498 RepID=UPI00300964BE